MTDQHLTPNYIVGVIVLGILIVGFALLVVAITRPFARHLPKSLVAHYVPPPGSVVQHGLALRADRTVLAATIVQLAVQKKVRVLAPRGSHGPVAIEARPGASFGPDERFFLQALRPPMNSKRKRRRYVRALANIGIHVNAPEEAPDISFLTGKGAFRGYQRRALSDYFDSVRRQMKQNGLARKFTMSVHLYVLSLLILALIVGGGIFALGAFMNGDVVGGSVAILTTAGVFGVLTIAPPPMMLFTPRGQELRRHLSGLRDYVRLAEQDRLRMLQSPQGALRTPAGALTPGGRALGLRERPTAGDAVAQSGLDRYVLIERMLPYAVLFRCEREWQKEFEYLGNADVTIQNLRALGSTLKVTMAILQTLAIIVQVFRIIGLVASLFGGGRQ
ncbi:DUF2207 domain-containing protein [Microbacterium sp. MPKO10]|uniref:DUF2207 domain-containing protein n=1 Tax=Microbacterium sp. MPKO10 TaxID=2989818 RepID=UPI002235C43C|nr:DUF2207 domain-containing protein [Microbacterium sp. MPKO10]MCW4457074.1 DUF2207 domain-containing protein [Microbacterium sp. MPKO10]